MNNALCVEALTKSYNGKTVLNGVNLQVKKGELLALLGTNGAGKTTVLECIEGLRNYDSGKVMISGKIGIQLQSSSLPAHIRPMEAIRLFAKWNKVKINQGMLKIFEINKLANKQYRVLSSGQKQRLHLVLALLSDPDILFLDEPTAGLDVEGRIALHEQIRALKQLGKTIILTSHDMAEVESLCDRLAILNNGVISFVGTLEELNRHIGKRHIISIQTNHGSEKHESYNLGKTLFALLQEYERQDITVLDIKIDHSSLEQDFIELTRRDET